MLQFKSGSQWTVYRFSWLNKKTTINPVNDGDKCFQCAEAATLNHVEIGEDLLWILKVKPFINRYY